MTSPNPNRHPRLGKAYRVGSTGARILWRDGSVTTHPPRSVITLLHVPERIEGRLYLVGLRSHLAYEAPSLEPA